MNGATFSCNSWSVTVNEGFIQIGCHALTLDEWLEKSETDAEEMGLPKEYYKQYRAFGKMLKEWQKDTTTLNPDGSIYVGICFQLQGKRTDEYSDNELWKMTKEAAIEGMIFPHKIIMPCGRTECYDNPTSIMDLIPVNIMCGCGNPNHYIVRFNDCREVVDDRNQRESI